MSAPRTLVVVITGAIAGFLAGFFGVGGGLVIVPALVAALGMDQRTAAATSLAAIAPTAVVGAVTYGLQGRVSLAAAAFLVPGALIGTRMGTWLLRRLAAAVLPWTFVAFIAMIIVFHQLHLPLRDAALALDWPRALALVGVGLVSGVMAGLVGVGGGSVIVPGLEIVVGVGDLMARGTSLLVMIPTVVYGTRSNLGHGLVDLRVAGLVGACAVVLAPVGTQAAAMVSPRVGTTLFNLFLLVVVATTLRKERARRRRDTDPGAGGE